MSQPTETLQDLLKPWKYLLFPPIKAMFIKGFIALSVLASLSLISYTFFSNNTKLLFCSECHLNYIHFRNYNQEKSHHEITNLSHILFGIGGSAKTWNNRHHFNEIWWKPNITRGFVWLDENPAEAWPASSPSYKVSEDSSRFKYTCNYGSRSAVRIARIVKESFQLGLDNIRWFVMGDDDTVFFPENLVTVLAKYDHNEMYYIGGISESVEQAVIHSYTMSYGGGGFAISYPLAAELVRVLDGCIDRYASSYGSDQKIGGCMSEIGVPITRELGFHQVDIRGNPYGLLAAHPLAPLVSLHHLDYVQPLFHGMSRIDSVKHLVEVYRSDPSRALQHSICYDLKRNWSISISWGYTVQLYTSLMTAKDLATPLRTFLTWRTWSTQPFTFNTRIQSLDPCERPVVYFLDGFKNLDDGGTLTLYKRPFDQKKLCKKENYATALSIQLVNVSAAILDPDIWNKAPRRQCCEVTSGGGGGRWCSTGQNKRLQSMGVSNTSIEMEP